MVQTVKAAILAASTLSSPNAVRDHLNNLNAGGGGENIYHGALDILFDVQAGDVELSLAENTLECEINIQSVEWEVSTTDAEVTEDESTTNFDVSTPSVC